MAVLVKSIRSQPRYIVTAHSTDYNVLSYADGYSGVVTELTQHGFFFKVTTSQGAAIQSDALFCLSNNLTRSDGTPLQVNDRVRVFNTETVGDYSTVWGTASTNIAALDKVKIPCHTTSARFIASFLSSILCECLAEPFLNLSIIFYAVVGYSISYYHDKNATLMLSPWDIASLIDWSTISSTSGPYQITNVSGTSLVSFQLTKNGASLPGIIHSGLRTKINSAYGVDISNAYVDLLPEPHIIPSARVAVVSNGS